MYVMCSDYSLPSHSLIFPYPITPLRPGLIGLTNRPRLVALRPRDPVSAGAVLGLQHLPPYLALFWFLNVGSERSHSGPYAYKAGAYFTDLAISPAPVTGLLV